MFTILFLHVAFVLERRLLPYFQKSNSLSHGSFYQLYNRVDIVSGEMFGHPGVSNMNRVHADVFRLFPYEFEECSTNAFGSIGDFLKS